MCACAKRQQINQYNNNVVHFFFRVDPNRTNRLFQIYLFFKDRDLFPLRCKLFPKFKNWISFVFYGLLRGIKTCLHFPADKLKSA